MRAALIAALVLTGTALAGPKLQPGTIVYEADVIKLDTRLIDGQEREVIVVGRKKVIVDAKTGKKIREEARIGDRFESWEYFENRHVHTYDTPALAFRLVTYPDQMSKSYVDYTRPAKKRVKLSAVTKAFGGSLGAFTKRALGVDVTKDGTGFPDGLRSENGRRRLLKGVRVGKQHFRLLPERVSVSGHECYVVVAKLQLLGTPLEATYWIPVDGDLSQAVGNLQMYTYNPSDPIRLSSSERLHNISVIRVLPGETPKDE